MIAWWQGLATRERRVVTLAGLVLLLVAAFLFVIEPGLQRRSALNSQLQILANEQAWMQARVSAVRAQLKTGGAAPAAPASGSPLGVVDVSARTAGLGAALRRVRPLESAVEAELEGASFTALVGWLATLESLHGLRVVSLSIDRGNEPGRVNAQLRIEAANGRS